MGDEKEAVLGEIRAERFRQDAKWGADREIDSVDSIVPIDERATFYEIQTEQAAKEACDSAFAQGVGTWADILVEELCEAIAAPDDRERRKELI